MNRTKVKVTRKPQRQAHGKGGAPTPLVIVSIMSLSLLAVASAQTYQQPYAAGSTIDNILNFNNGSAGTVTAPDPAYVVGLGYSSTPASGTGGGWAIGSSGSTAFGVGLPPVNAILGTSNAQTAVSSSALNFNISNTGVSNLLGASLPMTWTASSTITGSDSWTNLGSQYVYQFDALLSNSLVSGSPDAFGSITLTIQAGSTTLYQQTGLAQILGIASITSSFYNDAQVGFNYNQADGPLNITWSANSTIDASLLTLLGNGTNTMYQVSNGAILAVVPEPASIALLIGAGGTLFLLRRRSGYYRLSRK